MHPSNHDCTSHPSFHRPTRHRPSHRHRHASSRLSSLAALGLTLASSLPSVLAQSTAGTFASGGNTLVSALMMFLGNEQTVYILDKAEGNAAQISGHAAWGALWDIQSHQAITMDVMTNSFCASGMHLPNGSFVSFGGNSGVGINGNAGSQKNPDGSGAWDSVYQDFDGRKSIRILNTNGCSSTSGPTALAAGANCGWYDNPTVLSMQKQRWYSSVEPTGNGTMVILGGFINGGYINRWYPVTDPITQIGQAENTYEYYPAAPNAPAPPVVKFLVDNGGLNAYAHMFLMNSGNIFVQANLSAMLWDHQNNIEHPLPPMPNAVVRVYPASGAVAMLPMTPANNYSQTILFCGGQNMTDAQWGGYAAPNIDTWNVPASNDCQRLTPEPQDGSSPQYIQDDDMIGGGRTMGQFIILPTGVLLVINGGSNGTAGYALGTADTPLGFMPYGPSLAAGPAFTPALYDPNASPGSRWSTAGLSPSTIPRLYHSTAILLPDASVLVAGSNPNPDVNTTTFFPTEYRAEIFYPPYFSSSVRPAPTGMPTTLSYGGPYFNITLPSSSYKGSSASAASNTTITLVRGGFTTHAMNMGQRHMQLNNTYTVNKDASIILHVSPPPPLPNLFQPGPALLFVNINGIPSNGTYVILGSGSVGAQTVLPVSSLPDSNVLVGGSGGTGTGTGDSSGSSGSGSKKSSVAAIAAGVAGALGLIAATGGLAALIIARRRQARGRKTRKSFSLTAGPSTGYAHPIPLTLSNNNNNDSREGSLYAPLHPGMARDSQYSASSFKLDHDEMDEWDPSTATVLASPRGVVPEQYRDDAAAMAVGFRGAGGHSPAPSQTPPREEYGEEYDPYAMYPSSNLNPNPNPGARGSAGPGGYGQYTPFQGQGRRGTGGQS